MMANANLPLTADDVQNFIDSLGRGNRAVMLSSAFVRELAGIAEIALRELQREATLKAKMDAYKALLAEAERVLEPFAEEARQIAENNPGWDHDDFQFRIGARPSTLGPYRAARAILTRIKEHNNG